jgi:pyridoxal phosphate enzyme (YggS family)
MRRHASIHPRKYFAYSGPHCQSPAKILALFRSHVNRRLQNPSRRIHPRSLRSRPSPLRRNLQSNTSARAAKFFNAIDSVDDFALAQRLDHARTELNATEKLRVLIEVRVENEATKTGAEVHTVPQLLEKLALLKNLEVAGLMCIPPFLEDPEKVRPYFQRLRKLRDDLASSSSLPLPVLSMGMSHDFEIAIQEGATEVRIGTAIFGTRDL